MFKLSRLVAGEWVEHSHPPVYALERAEDGKDKVLATVPSGDPYVFKTLSNCLTPPFYLLYVLHTPRGEGTAGRYQSGEFTREDSIQFLRRFESLLRADSRFDFWLHSAADRATLVWDRHNLIHGYGPLQLMVEALRSLGFYQGEPVIPRPHAHHYHDEFDEDAAAVLSCTDWEYFPLQPEDEQ